MNISREAECQHVLRFLCTASSRGSGKRRRRRGDSADKVGVTAERARSADAERGTGGEGRRAAGGPEG